MPDSRYAVFRYEIEDTNGKAVPADDDPVIFSALKGLRAAYRVKDAQQADMKHFMFDFRNLGVKPAGYFSFGVGFQITERPERQFDPITEKISLVLRDANDMRSTRGVHVPELRVAAFRDGSGDDLSGTGGAGRVRAIFEAHSDLAIRYQLTASPEDIDRAVDRLRLIEMRFDVRPFNPHPSNPGLELDRLMKIGQVGKLTATARPHEGGAMLPAEGGLISEAKGLSDKGYGHFGLKAKTDEGAVVSYKKPALVGDKEKDQALEEKPRHLYISVDAEGGVDREEERLVAALKQLYGPDEKPAEAV